MGSSPLMTEAVFPTRVGMNRLSFLGIEICERIPHTRGDEPALAAYNWGETKYSPHAWG